MSKSKNKLCCQVEEHFSVTSVPKEREKQRNEIFFLFSVLRFSSPPRPALRSRSDVSAPGSFEGQQPRKVHAKFTRIY